jgi:hypothetical protein
MIGKVHRSDGKIIFACCDKELLDKKIKYLDIEITISSSFYGTEKLNKEQILENISCCDCANIFGNKICDFLLSEKIITKEQVVYFDNIAHVQIYKL